MWGTFLQKSSPHPSKNLNRNFLIFTSRFSNFDLSVCCVEVAAMGNTMQGALILPPLCKGRWHER